MLCPVHALLQELYIPGSGLSSFDSIGEMKMLLLKHMGVHQADTAPLMWELVPTTKRKIVSDITLLSHHWAVHPHVWLNLLQQQHQQQKQCNCPQSN
jgi:hypothetical protein